VLGLDQVLGLELAIHFGHTVRHKNRPTSGTHFVNKPP